MATSESTSTVNPGVVLSLADAANIKIQATIKALELQLELPDLNEALPTMRGLLDTIGFYAESLANEIDVACSEHAAESV